jgi:predicted outer membrane protein
MTIVEGVLVMTYGKGLVILGIMAASGVTVLSAPPKTEQPEIKKPGEVSVTKTVEERTSWRDGDHFLATCIAINNQEEVLLSQWAQDRLQNAKAKEFAKMMVKDHSAVLTKLQQFAPEATEEHFLTSTNTSAQEIRTDGKAEERPGAARREERRRERAENKGKDDTKEDNEPNDKDDQASRKGQGTIQQVSGTTEYVETKNLNVDLMQLHREVAEQCLADTKEMLTAKSDQEFDACFMGLQIARHAALKTKLTVYERHATGELKDLLSQAKATTTEHLEHAQQIMKELAPEAKTAATK